MATKDVLKRTLKEKLIKRLDNFSLVAHQPQLFIADYFGELRHKIDLFTEESMIEINSRNDELNLDRISRRRMAMIDEVNAYETQLRNAFGEWNQETRLGAVQKIETWTRQVEEAFSDESKSLDDLEDLHDEIDDQLDESSRKLEATLLQNNSLIFIKEIHDMYSLGYLLCVNGYYIQHPELFERLDQFFDNKKSDYMVATNYRFTYVYILLVRALLKMLNNRRIVDQGLNGIIKVNGNNNDSSLPISKHENDLISFNIKEVENTSFPPFKYSNFRVPKIESEFFDFFGRNQWLYLSNNEIVEMNEDDFKKLKKIYRVEMINTFKINTPFTLNFLESYTMLGGLFITVPPGDFDAYVLSKLVNLQSIWLYGSASQDSNLERNKIDKNSFNFMINNFDLIEFSLCGFTIEEIGKCAFRNLEKLTEINMSNNKIKHLDEDAFDCLPMELKKIIFVSNQVEQDDPQKTQLDFSPSRKTDVSKKPIEAKLVLTCSGLKDIKQGIFNNSLTYKSIDMSHNPIASIAPYSFVELSNLVELNLSYCQLKSINNLMFVGLAKLSTLDLSFNQIYSIDLIIDASEGPVKLSEKATLTVEELQLVKELMFNDLVKLTVIDLSYNMLKKVDFQIFQNMTTLHELRLANNRIDEICPDSTQTQMDYVDKVDLCNNQLTFVTTNSFAMFKKSLHLLWLENNHLERLDNGFLEQFENIREIRLASNQLDLKFELETLKSSILHVISVEGNRSVEFKQEFFKGKAFKTITSDNVSFNISTDLMTSYVTQITFAKSSNNVIQKLREIQIPFKCLNSLDLSGNSIQTLDELDLGKICPTLARLILSKNKISDFKMSWIVNLKRFYVLDLSDNLIENFDFNNFFNDHRYIQEINLSGNRIKSITRSDFSKSERLYTLNLSNMPNTLELNNLDVFENLTKLLEINLSGNNLQEFDMRRRFVNNKFLESIDLSNNLLDNQSINKRAFEKLKLKYKLKTLKLSNNKLNDLGFIRDLEALEELDVSRNEIESIYDSQTCNLFGKLFKIKCLNLEGNRLRAIPEKAFDHFRSTLEKLLI